MQGRTGLDFIGHVRPDRYGPSVIGKYTKGALWPRGLGQLEVSA